MADDELTPEEMNKRGAKDAPDELSPEEMAKLGGKPTTAPRPRSFSQSDEELGLATGPVKSARLPGTALSVPLRPSMSQTESDALNDQASEGAGRVEGALGDVVLGQLAGAGLAKAGGALLGKGAPAAAKSAFAAAHGYEPAAAAAKPLFDRTVAAGKAAITSSAAHTLLGATVGGMMHHPLIGTAIGAAAHQLTKPAAAAIARYAPAIGSGIVAAVPPVAGAATAAVGATRPEGPMTNAITKLRASAAGNPRAADLLARIQAIQSPNFEAGTGEVTQGTLAGTP